MERFHFGTNLRQIRLSQDLSQEYVAQRVGVSQSSYSRWEQESKPTIQVKQINDLALCLNVPVNQIVGNVRVKPYKVLDKKADINYLFDAKKPKPRSVYILALFCALLFLAYALYEFFKGFIYAFNAAP